MAKEYTELQLKAKEAGIKGWHVKLAKTLEAELGEEVSEKIEIAVEAVEEAVEAVVEAVDPMKLLKLMAGRTWDQAMMNIKCLANKGDLWEFRELITEEYDKEMKEKQDKENARASNNGNQ
jgi:hypothetical protein